MIRILHCVTDEKFVDCIIKTFDFLGDRCLNRYIHVEKEHRDFYLYLDNFEKIDYMNSSCFLDEVIKWKCDVVILHNIQSLPLSVIPQIPSKVTVVWFAWGFDIYGCIGSRPLVNVPYSIKPETQRLLQQSCKDYLLQKGKSVYKFFRNGKLKNAVNRVDFFSGIIPEEYEMMKKNKFFRAKQIEYRYSSPQANITMSLLDTAPFVDGMDIMIGNSGDPTNNHADIFLKLADVELGDRRVVVPLSYGGTPKYRNQIKELGKELWGDNFVAIDDYMPYEDYRKTLSACYFRIFGHERQQALGNIRMALRDGCKVFMSESSILYKHHTEQGIKIYSIQHDINSEMLSSKANPDETYLNRRIVVEDTLSSKTIDRLYKMIEILEKK